MIKYRLWNMDNSVQQNFVTMDSVITGTRLIQTFLLVLAESTLISMYNNTVITHSVSTDFRLLQTSFLPLNQQCQSTEGKSTEGEEVEF